MRRASVLVSVALLSSSGAAWTLESPMVATQRAGVRRTRSLMSNAAATVQCGREAADDSVPESDRWVPVPDALSARCNGVCTVDGSSDDASPLCVYRDQEQRSCSSSLTNSSSFCVSGDSCSYECFAPLTAATAWTIEWLDNEVDGSDGVVLTFEGKDSSRSSASVAKTITRVTETVRVPNGLQRLTIRSPQTFPLKDVNVSAMFTKGQESLEELHIHHQDMSKWTSFPSFPKLTTLTLHDVGMTKWPPEHLLSTLREVVLDENPLLSSTNFSLPTTIQRLSLNGCGFRAVPESVKTSSQLSELSMNDNDLRLTKVTGVLPTQLTALSLRNCRLEQIPGDIGLLSKLTELDLSQNPDLHSLPGPVFPNTLRKISLAAIGLKQFPNGELKGLKLTALDISSNSLGDDTLDESLKAFGELETLDLSSTGLTRLPSSLQALSKLSTLSVANNEIDTLDATALPSLTHLNVAGNPLSTLPDEMAERSSALLTLNASRCAFKSLSSTILSGASALTELDLSYNELESLPTSLANAPALRVLDISHNVLTAIPRVVFSLKKLERLDLRGNSFEKASLRLRSSQIEFLRRVAVFQIDSAAFDTDCDSPKSVRSSLKVCVDDTEATGDDASSSLDSGRTENGTVSSSSNDVVLLSAGAGGLFLLVVIGSVIYRRRRAMKAEGKLDEWPLNELSSDRQMSELEWRQLQMWAFWDDPEVLRLRIPWELIRERQVVGSGASTVLWLAQINGRSVFLRSLQSRANHEKTVVAYLIREVQLLRKLHHPGIVRFIGVTWMNAPTDVQLVLEEMPSGDLRSYLDVMQTPQATRWRHDGFALRIALQIAQVLAFLHSQEPYAIVHRDIRSHNVLLDDELNAKLTGFGRHSFVGRDPERISSNPGGQASLLIQGAGGLEGLALERNMLLDAGRWMAPELLRGEVVSEYEQALDVYSFGVLLLELDTVEAPFSGSTGGSTAIGRESHRIRNQDESGASTCPLDALDKLAESDPTIKAEAKLLRRLMRGQIQVTLPSSCPMGIGDLILQCLAHEPENRPTAQHILDTLQQMILRCFPHCCPDHVERSFCGSSLRVRVDGVPEDRQLRVLAYFRLNRTRGYSIGDTIVARDVMKSLQSETNASGQWIASEELTEPHERTNTRLFLVNPSARWFYGWESGVSKAHRLQEHTLSVVVVTPVDDWLHVVAVASSPPFKMISFRRATVSAIDAIQATEEMSPKHDQEGKEAMDLDNRRIERSPNKWRCAEDLALVVSTSQRIQVSSVLDVVDEIHGEYVAASTDYLQSTQQWLKRVVLDPGELRSQVTCPVTTTVALVVASLCLDTQWIKVVSRFVHHGTTRLLDRNALLEVYGQLTSWLWRELDYYLRRRNYSLSALVCVLRELHEPETTASDSSGLEQVPGFQQFVAFVREHVVDNNVRRPIKHAPPAHENSDQLIATLNGIWTTSLANLRVRRLGVTINTDTTDSSLTFLTLLMFWRHLSTISTRFDPATLLFSVKSPRYTQDAMYLRLDTKNRWFRRFPAGDSTLALRPHGYAFGDYIGSCVFHKGELHWNLYAWPETMGKRARALCFQFHVRSAQEGKALGMAVRTSRGRLTGAVECLEVLSLREKLELVRHWTHTHDVQWTYQRVK
ncbi:hypothetical protein Poli38472_010972 [Pythium oligandrum]|uniref:non-specific serine/threonine protein kinase n=1 Tax=Pythium oligandrum TaxID=41045 RepID=A0A8K1CF61_PYTOL|nr:hypothetical protein Poli38472_010972 [Pythium oligandrum]|eukprot:TMW61909.1 hypothetical protein Poli38472_010972 [Pythium oligandrum]